MCGFIGIVDDNLNRSSEVEKAMVKIRHRGPDNTSYFSDSRVYLGHNRLSIIDVKERSNQPLESSNGNYILVFNGEIYNYLELKLDLSRKGYSFKTSSDTEVLLAAYITYGKNFLSKLDGMFAFCIYDKKNRIILLARDRAGEKPLYYSLQNGIFLFSSELKGLVDIVDFDIDTESLDMYFTLGYIPAPRSILNNVSKLKPAEIISFSINDKSLKKEIYWNSSDNQIYDNNNYDESVECFTNLLDKSVKNRLRSDVPLGVLLSGGIDSSSIAAIASKHEANIKTFSVISDDASFNEQEFSDIVANELGTEHSRLRVTADDAMKVLLNMGELIDEPFSDMSLIPTFLLTELVSSKVKVAIGGDGADEILAGYPLYSAHQYALMFNKLPNIFRKGMEIVVNRLPVSHKDFSFDFKAKRFIKSSKLELVHRHFEWQAHIEQNQKNQLYGPFMKDSNQIAINFYNKVSQETKKMSTFDRITHLDFNYYLPNNILHKVDIASMKSSLELRSPFLDHKLVEYCLSLPPEFKLSKGISKKILKSAMELYLPNKVLYRSKKGFGIPLGRWFKDEIFSQVRDIVLDPSVDKFLDRSFRERVMNMHRSGKEDNRKIIYSILVFVTWYKKYV